MEECNGKGKKMKNRLEKDQTGIHIEEKKKEQWENGQSSRAHTRT